MGNGIVDNTISYDIFVDRNNNGTFNDQDDHRIYRTGTTLTHGRADRARPTTGASPLTYRVTWARDQILRARMRDVNNIDTDPTQTGVQSMASLDSLNYTTDGEAGLSRDEARSFLRDFEARFGSDDAGRARMRLVLDQNPVFEFGPDGNFRLNDIYTRAGVTPPGATARAETGALPPPGSAANPNDPNNPVFDALSNYLNDPSQSNLSQLRAQKARTDGLLAMLLAKLAQGDTDVLTACFDLVAANGRGQVAQTAMQTIAAMRNLNQRIEELNQRLQTASGNLSSTDAATRARAQGDISAVQTQLSTLNGQRQQLVGTLESCMRAMEEESRTAQSIRDSYRAAHMAGVPRG